LSRYTATTNDDLAHMLASVGVGSIEELFERQVPAGVRLGRELDLGEGLEDLGEGLGEEAVWRRLRELARRNTCVEGEISFMGAGMYDHYVPALIDMLCERSEFLTPYTPYQPEISQGGLQAMFEYQTAICELTGLAVSNASVYEGPSALAAAAYMAKLHNGRRRLVVSAGLHPHSIETLRTYAHGYGMEVVEVPLVRNGAGAGVTDADAWRQAIDGETSAAMFAQPNWYGAVEDAVALSRIAKETAGGEVAGGGEAIGAGEGGAEDDSRKGADARGGAPGAPVVVAQVDPITLGVLRSPGECGVDVAVGEGQALGNRLDYGGPSFGLMAAREQYIRRLPGRIAGETQDVDGRRGFVLTLQTREQHIRREKATSNICTSQALNALAGVVYLTWLGREGILELGELLLARTDYARTRLSAIEGVQAMHAQPVVREFALRLSAPDGEPADVAAIKARCARAGVNPGVDMRGLSGRDEDRGGLLVAITERRSRADIDRLVEVLGEAMRAELAPELEVVPA
jgi:glycine cleavage system P protein (glycine dehydrogenase) subunit 1